MDKQTENLEEAAKKFDNVEPGASFVKLDSKDNILKVIIDLKVPDDKFIETRVGAFGALEWAKELASRWIMEQELKFTKEKFLKDQQKSVVKPGVIDTSKFGKPH